MDNYTGTTTTEVYLGHTEKYWVEYALGWLPCIVLLVPVMAVFSRVARRQRAYMSAMMESQATTNKLLGEISAKLDKR